MLLIQADARALPLPDGYVQTAIMSPPYWGLRDYGVAPLTWGGEAGCGHTWATQVIAQRNHSGDGLAALGAQYRGGGHKQREAQQMTAEQAWCQTCGAWRGALGLEPTPELYVEHLVEILREVRRVLREDGTCWVNLGDSYVTAPRGNKPGDYSTSSLTNPDRQDDLPRASKPGRIRGLKSKDLVGIPWRVAFALQADGWYLRSDIIWAKPNPMPESVTDRPTRSHEYLFLLTKRERYYYDHEAIKETSTNRPSGNKRRIIADGTIVGHRVNDHLGSSVPYVPDGSGRNRRSVWTITPKPFRGAHFATFPPELVEPCLLAGAPPCCCAACGAPYRRVIERGGDRREQQRACGGDRRGEYHGEAQKDFEAAGAQNASEVKARILAGMVERRTIGWSPTCACEPATTAQSVVLDPFCGSGTVGVVAKHHGRFFIGTDLKPEYLQMAHCRITGAGC